MEAFREAKERFLERSTVEAGGQRFYVEAEREAFAGERVRHEGLAGGLDGHLCWLTDSTI